MIDKIKYPRTNHVPSSPGGTSDDKRLSSLDHFLGKEIVISEKMDGENSTLSKEYNHARSLDSVDHPSRHWLKGLWGTIRFDIPEGWRICGENLYAKHSIHYIDLESYFQVFSIWNENNVCLSYDDTKEWCNLLGLTMVPTLWRGIFNEERLRYYELGQINGYLNVERLCTEKKEGYVIRLADSFKFEDFDKSVAKWVRKNHVNPNSDHWIYKKIIPNFIKK